MQKGKDNGLNRDGSGTPGKSGNQGARNRRSGASSGVPFRGFINYTPVQADRGPFSDYLSAAADLNNDLCTAVEQGHKLSISYDQRSDSFVAALYGNVETCRNAGKCLTQRSNDWYKAMAKVLYVHVKVFEEVWPDNEQGRWSDELE